MLLLGQHSFIFRHLHESNQSYLCSSEIAVLLYISATPFFLGSADFASLLAHFLSVVQYHENEYSSSWHHSFQYLPIFRLKLKELIELLHTGGDT